MFDVLAIFILISLTMFMKAMIRGLDAMEWNGKR